MSSLFTKAFATNTTKTSCLEHRNRYMLHVTFSHLLLFLFIFIFIAVHTFTIKNFAICHPCLFYGFSILLLADFLLFYFTLMILKSVYMYINSYKFDIDKSTVCLPLN